MFTLCSIRDDGRGACRMSGSRDQRGDEGVFDGALTSASAHPQRSEESQGDGCPRPAFEVSAAG